MGAPTQSPNSAVCGTAGPADDAVRTFRAPDLVLRGSLALIGFTAVIAQVVLMRELMVVFVGNEVSLGLTLASWLLWTAIGSDCGAKLFTAGVRPAVAVGCPSAAAAERSSARLRFALLLVVEATAFPATIFLVRASRALFHAQPGELLGPGSMLLTSFFVLSFFCLASGALFAAGARIYAFHRSTSTAESGSSVYLLEALGSALGGILASLVLIRFLNSCQIAAIIVLLNLFAAALTFARARRVIVALVAVAVAGTCFAAAPRLERASLARLWRGFDLVTSRNSVYGNLAVIGGEGSRSTYENGLNLFSAPDPAAAEEAVHYALLEHPAPSSVLLLGGGVNGSAVEILRHPTVQRVDYVELDPAIFILAQSYFPAQWAALRADWRIHIHNADGRLFLKTTASSYDVIIVNLPDPQTAQLNRFYTREFFREAAARLHAGGLLALQLRSSENYISPERAEFLACINRTLRDVFPEVTAIPGETVHFFAASHPGVLTPEPQELIARLKTRNLQTSYVREYYLPFRMMPDRMADLAQQIQPRLATPINRDFAPVAYYFDVLLWSAQFSRGYQDVLHTAATVRFSRVLPGTIVVLALASMLIIRRQRRARASAGLCVAGMGFTMISLEVLLLLGFQAIYGYVYHQLAILIAAFMAGLALGSRCALRLCGGESLARPTRDEDPGAGLRTLALLQLFAAAAPLLLFAVLAAFTGVRSAAGLLIISHFVCPLLALCCGVLGGYQFPVAVRIFAVGKHSGPGTLYALDLAGSCLAALVISAYFVPVFGFLQTAVLIAAVDLVVAAVARWAVRPQASLA